MEAYKPSQRPTVNDGRATTLIQINGCHILIWGEMLPHSSLLLRRQITDINDITLCHTITSQAEFETSIAYLTVQHNRSRKTVLCSSRRPGPHCGKAIGFTTVTPGLLCPMKTAGWWRGHAPARSGRAFFGRIDLLLLGPGQTTPREEKKYGSARTEKT